MSGTRVVGRGSIVVALGMLAWMLVDVSPAARAQTTQRVFELRLFLVNDAPDHHEAMLRWVDAQVASANALFRSTHVQFRMTGWRPVSSEQGGVIRSIEELIELADDREAIDVFVVPRLDVPFDCAFGLGLPPSEITRSSGLVAIVPGTAPVLAHSLGHFFGLTHSEDPASLMYPQFTPGDYGERLSLDVTQARLVTAESEAFEHASRPPVVPFVSCGPSVGDGM